MFSYPSWSFSHSYAPDILQSRSAILACVGHILAAIAVLSRCACCRPTAASQWETRDMPHLLQRIRRGEMPAGSYLVDHLFQVRIDGDLPTPYGDPMQGTLIYLSRHPEPGILNSTLGLGSR